MTACIAILSIAACGRSPTRPIHDGYTLHGVVLDAGGGRPAHDAPRKRSLNDKARIASPRCGPRS